MKTKPSPAWNRLEQIISYSGEERIASFARRLGLKRAENLYQIKRGNNGISRDLAETILCRFPELSFAWILTGEGEMLPTKSDNPVLKQITGIPFFGDFPRNRLPVQPDKILYFSKELLYDADFACSCNTDELLPLYKKKSVLFMRRCALDKPVVYGEIYFVITDYCRLYRIIRKTEDDARVRLVSPNRKKYDDMIIPLDDITELYLVL